MAGISAWVPHKERHRMAAARIEPLPEDRKAWLLEIARHLKADYEALLEPVPPRFARLLEELEASPD
jgi:hypothetical protein